MKPIIFDTESTGVDHEKDQVIEAAWLHIPETPAGLLAAPNAKQFAYFEQRYRPTVPIQYGAQAVHHILACDLIGCPDPATFRLPDDVDCLIGHNVDFDWRMIGQPAIARIDTLALSRYFFPEKDSHTQSAMLYMIGRLSGREESVRNMLRNAHAALDDVRNCSVLLRFLLKHAQKSGHSVDTWEEVQALSDVARIPTIMGFGKHKGTPIARGQLDPSYVQWYRRQPETDPYYIEAFKRAGF